MTIAASTRKAGPYVGNGVATSFTFGFKVFAAADVAVHLLDSSGVDHLLVLNSDYGVLLNPDQNAAPGGTITYPLFAGSPLPSTSTLTVIGGMQPSQLTNLTNGGRYDPAVQENAYDKLTILIQQVLESQSRSLQAAVGTNVTLAFPAPSSGKFIRWRSDLTGLENVSAGTDSMTLQGLLADAGDVTHGSALIGCKVNATGSSGRTLADKLSERVSIKDFGAIGDGVADDTFAIQTAINWAGPLGRELYFPRGSYLYSGATVSAGWSIRFVGESTANTFLNLRSGTATGFNCATELPVVFEKLTLQYNGGVVGTAGSFISIPGGATMNANSRFRDLQMTAPWIGINATGAYLWVAERVFIGNYLSSGIAVGNTFNGDAGDSTIRDCLFSTTSTTAAAITHLSSGGLRVINNKNIGGFCFYQLNLAAGVNTSDLLITGNSIEGTSSSGLLANRQGSGTFSNITITGNQFAGVQFPVNFNDGTAGWLNNIAISGNVIPVLTGGVGVNISAAGNFMVGNNAFSAADATSKAISVAVTASSGRIGENQYTGFTVAYTNLSTTTSSAKKVLQGITGTITCSTAVGPLYKGTAAVSFPAGFFGSTPVVTATMGNGANGVGANAVGAGTTGVTIEGIAVSNGATVACYWRAEADY